MMAEVRFSPEAQADLIELYSYIADRSSAKTASSFVDRIEQCSQGLSIFPERGTSRGDLRPGLRTLGFERRALIVFLAKPDRVLILRILYGGQDFAYA